MSQSKQYSLILRKCGAISEDLKKIRTDIHTLMSIQGATTAELNMLKERFDIFANQPFMEQALKERK